MYKEANMILNPNDIDKKMITISAIKSLINILLNFTIMFSNLLLDFECLIMSFAIIDIQITCITRDRINQSSKLAI